MIKIFLDTSVLFTAVDSASGGSRELFKLAEDGGIRLYTGQNVLRECESVIRRKKQKSLPIYVEILESGSISIVKTPGEKELRLANSFIDYEPDAYVFAEALFSGVDWFITHDKKHFLNKKHSIDLPIRIGTPGDFIQFLTKPFIN